MPVSLARSFRTQIACKTPFSTKKNQGFQNLLKPVISQFLQNSLFMLYKAIWREVQGRVILDYFAHLRTHLIFSNLFTKNFPYTFMRVFRNIQAPRRTKEQEQRAPQTPRHSSLYLFPFTYSCCIFPDNGNFCQRMSYTIKMLTRGLYFSRIVKTFT